MSEDLMNIEIAQQQNASSYKDTPIILEKEFYKNVRNELTETRLRELSLLAKNIKEPNIYGTYNNEAHFLATLDFFLKTTLETRHRGIFLLKEIIPKLYNRDNLLDVGAADGQTTKWIGNKFRNITILDTNKEAIKNFNIKNRIIKSNINLSKICASVLDCELPSNFFDLGLLSHVLYYIEHDKWLETTARVYESVKIGGIILVVLNGDTLGKAHLIDHFKGKKLNIDSFINKCSKRFPKASISVYVSNESAVAIDLLSMLHIASFFLYDVGAIATKSDLVAYVNRHNKLNDFLYSITFQQKFILIRKDG